MRAAWRTGVSFGMTSGVITTLGLMVGLNAGTHERLPVIGGILTIAIADAFSDALGIHVAQETQSRHTGRSVWEATIMTFLAKLVVALTFVVPVVFFELGEAILISVGWGMGLLAMMSYAVARQEKQKPGRVIREHLAIGIIVIIAANLVGRMIAMYFR